MAGAQAVVVGASDSTVALHNRNGLDIPKLIMHKENTASLRGFPEAEVVTPEELLSLDCEILIPAALENVITWENAHAVHARIVAEAANGPVTPEADRIFDQAGVFLVPDILCNAGGATVSCFEWVRDEDRLFWDGQDVDCRLERVMTRAFNDVLGIHLDRKVSMRLAATMLGVSRVADAHRIRGLYP
jgi:glutamate dehydrogenase/leucine dehydrogenase